MFQKEGQMYDIIKKFLIKEKSCSRDKTFYTNEKGATNGKTLSLNLFQRTIEPDVYGVTDDDVVFMAEGKLSYEGKELDSAITQGNSYQRFSHYAYVFFPKYVFEKANEIRVHVEDVCKRNNLGLLFVPQKGEAEEIVAARPSKFLLDERMWKTTLGNIENARDSIVKLLLLSDEAKGVGNVHLAMLRDISYLLNGEWQKEDFIDNLYRQNLLSKYRRCGENGGKSSLSLYDWSYKKPLLKDLSGEKGANKQPVKPDEKKKKFRTIADEAIKTLLYLGICQIEKENIRLSLQGNHFRNYIEKHGKEDLYSTNTATINDLFISILLGNSEVRKYILKLCKEIAKHDPQPTVLFWCPNCELEKRSWELKKEDWETINKVYRRNGFCCFKCKYKNVPRTHGIFFNWKYPELNLNYRLNILLEESEILGKRRFKQLPLKVQEELRRNNLSPPINTVYWVLGKNAPLPKISQEHLRTIGRREHI